jgi:hypothetical protein
MKQLHAALVIFESERAAQAALHAGSFHIPLPQAGNQSQQAEEGPEEVRDETQLVAPDASAPSSQTSFEEDPNQPAETAATHINTDMTNNHSSGKAAAPTDATDMTAATDMTDVGRFPEPDADLDLDGPHMGVMNCTILPSDHDHYATVRENPYWGPWHCSPTSLEVRDGEVVNRYTRSNYNSSTNQAAPTLAFADCFTRRKRSVPYRLRERIWRQNEDAGDTSPMGLWNKGKQDRGEII